MAIPFVSNGQEKEDEVKLKSLTYYDGNSFSLEGTVVPGLKKERTYDRLPFDSKENVHSHVWYISRTSAGLALRFQTNASKIGVRWEALRDEKLNHMAPTGVKGLDLYYKSGDEWIYINTAKPTDKTSSYLLVDGASDSLRDFRLYLPLYDGLEKVEIGIDEWATISGVESNWSMNPIVYYGTSITQGGCASRPGMAYTNIVSRKLNAPCINLGFSGNGRMEQGVAEAMADMKASMYVIDCVGNMSVDQIHQNVAPLVDILRKKTPETPIVFLESLMFERALFNDSLRELIIKKNNALREEFKTLINEGNTEVYLIEMSNATGTDREGSVDGIHLTDLGFLRLSNYLVREFRKIGLITNY